MASVWIYAKCEDVRIQQEGAAWVKQQKGHLFYDFGLLRSDGSYPSDVEPGGPAWLRDRLGIDYFSAVHGVILDNQEIVDLTPLTKLKDLRSLAIMTDIMPGTSLRPIGQLKQLEKLTLDCTRIDREELTRIRRELAGCEIILGDRIRLDYDKASRDEETPKSSGS